MRILRLALERYGHVSGEALDFPADRGLHVVVGANEAGKSTALEALADGLFGWSRKHSRRFAHPDNPSITLTLRAADGTEASFVRRQAGRDKLVDPTGAPIPEATLARFLGGITRERFRDVYGLDGERLRQGGRAILAEHGELGAAVLQARTGLSGQRELLERLDAQAKELFGDGRGQRRISLAAAAVKDNRKLILERSLSGPEHGAASTLLADLSGRLEAIQAEADALRGEQSRLERIRRTAPWRRAMSDVRDRLVALGPPPSLPSDAADRQRGASDRLDQAGRDASRDQARLALVEAALAALRPDPAILAEAAAVADLSADLSRIAQARRDSLTVAGQAAERLRSLDATATRLGVPERGPALRQRLPAAAVLSSADRLLKRHGVLLAESDGASKAVHEAAEAAHVARERLAAAPQPASAGPLNDAFTAANAEGDIDAALAEAAAQAGRLAAAAAAALAGLPLWDGPADLLRASPPPLAAEAARIGQALERAESALAAAVEERAAQGRKLDAVRADMAGMVRAGPLPTADAIAALRTRRDAAWRLLRRHYEGGAAPSPEEWPQGAPLAAELERLVHEADHLADQRITGAIRLAAWEAARAEEGRLEAGQAGLDASVRDAGIARDAAQAAWIAAWSPARVAPLGPPAMREWVAARDAVLAATQAADDARHRHGAVAARHHAAAAALMAALPDLAAGEDVARLRRLADRRLTDLAGAATLHREAAQDADRTAAAERAAQESLAANGRAVADWQGEWTPVAGRLGLDPLASPQPAAETLADWRSVQAGLDLWATLDERLQDMTRTIAGYDAGCAALAARLGVAPAERMVSGLVPRLDAAKAAAAEQARLEAERDALAAAIARHTGAMAEGAAILEALRRQAGAADDAALAACIAAMAEHAELATRRRSAEAQLLATADGRTEAELEAEAAPADIDAIPGRLHAIGGRLRELDADRTETSTQRERAQARLHAMEAGQDVAGPALAVQDGLTEIEEAAHRYVRLRLAHAALKAGIEGFRRSQQGPLLARASTMFAELTDGRYAGLELDETDKGEPFIVAVRPDRTTCPAEMLSEGTRDQQFLALRLASIDMELDAGERLPFIADDLLVNFDDTRARAALRLLARFGQRTQVVLFTHHAHLAPMVDTDAASLHRLPRELAGELAA